MIAHRTDGTCPFQDEDKLCFIHRRFGEDHLSRVCQTYPRKVARVGRRLEVTATLSCPVVARGCLLGEDATALVRVDPGRHADSRLLLEGEVPAGQAEPFFRYLDEVREVILHLLADRRYPLASRLFFTLFFANRLEPFFRPGSEGFSEEALAAQVDFFSRPDNLLRLHQEFASLEPSIALPMAMIQTILLSRAGRAATSFEGLLWQVWATYGGSGEINSVLTVENTDENIQVDAGSMLDRYQKCRDRLQTAFGARIDLYFENYCRNYWFSQWYTHSGSVLEHAQKLLVRVAVLRFLFFSHPGLAALVDMKEETTDARAMLDRTAVEVFYKFSRGIEHDQNLLTQVHKTLNEQGMEGFAHSVLLVKF